MTRVTFTAARRARAELFARDAVLRTLATRFSCGPAEVPAAIDKIARDAEAAGTELTALRGRLASLIAASFPGPGPWSGGPAERRSCAASRPSWSPPAAMRSCARPRTPGRRWSCSAPRARPLDCGALWKALAAGSATRRWAADRARAG